ncbi:hypothetical protein [Anoxybacteroides rupiense]|uniref:hypothetical protein n=1 Tax=Anoxybacteroides rupiense TaxID=311460 RepID=UPI0036718E32
MFKKILIAILFLSLPIHVSAEDATCSNGECTFPYYGTNDTIAIIWADSTYRDDTFTRVKIDGNGDGKLRWYDANQNVLGEQVLTGPIDFSFPPGAYGFKLFASTGEFHAVEAWSTNPNSAHIVFGAKPNGGGGNCIGCDLFNCPGWSQYMGKLEEIKDSIPPAPNWGNVATIFRDIIVPKLIADMGEMLGTAPTPPAEPPDLSGVDTHDIEDKVPNMPDSGLDTSGFTKGNIESQAPEIEFRDDESGGFDIVNPIDTLPDLPDKMPEPGNTDAGEWDAGHPKEPEDQPMPIPKDQDGTPDIGNPPIPNHNNDTPPSPGDNTGNPPIPHDDSMPDAKNYKKHPDDPDGSG